MNELAMKTLTALFILSCFVSLNAQTTFGTQQVITTSADGAVSVYAIDLDGDGDADVMSASTVDDKIAWYENLGGGSFGTQQVITTGLPEGRGAQSVSRQRAMR